MATPTIKLIAADLDGTLLTDEKRIVPQTLEAIRALPRAGVRFVIASARPPRSVRHIYRELGLDTLQINYNGALVWDEMAGEAVDHRPLAGELALRIIRFARALDAGLLVTCEILDRWHTDRLDNSFTTQTGLLFKPDVIAPVETYCNGPVTKLLILGDPAVIGRLRPLVAERFAREINMVSTDPEMLQIMARNVSKAAALEVIVRRYGVPFESVLAIGDGENDIEMLRECGVGVAVGNAAPHLKEVADWIAPSPNSHGVLEAIRRYVGAQLGGMA